MDVHRSRFVPYPASSINALAFSQPSGSAKTGTREEALRLAVGRANGDIEIWNPLRGAWFHETTFQGGKDRSVEGLEWIQEPDELEEDESVTAGQLRLFSIGYSSAVTEWDFATGLPLRHSSGNASEIWSIAAQPKWQPRKSEGESKAQIPREGEFRGQDLVAGCADGSVVLLSTADNDLRFQKYLTRPTKRQARCLSITYQNPDIVLAGFADSMIRVFDTRKGSMIWQISLGSGPTGGPKEILVWDVKCLPNGDIVSGDSTGDLRFFDAKHYSQLQRISAHEADVLAVAVSRDGETVFSTGPDRRTVTYRLGSAKPGTKRRFWSKTSHQRYHSHDVKALASFEGKKISILASGGADTDLQIHPVRAHDEEYTRNISGLPQDPPVTSVQAGRLLASWWDREVWIWQMHRDSKQLESHKLMTKIALKGEESISSVSLSANGKILAVATAAEVKLFCLQVKGIPPLKKFQVRKLETPRSLQTQGARSVELSPDGKWLAIVRHKINLQLCRITHDDETGKPEVISSIQDMHRHHVQPGNSAFTTSAGRYDRTVTRMQFSHDSRVFVTSDLSGNIDCWVLKGHEDPTAPEADVGDDASSDSDEEDEQHGTTFFGQTWWHIESLYKIPKLESAPMILTFRPPLLDNQAPEPNGNPALHPTRHNPHPEPHDFPTGNYRLVVLTARHHLYEFHPLSGRITDWSQRNTTTTLPAEFRKIRDRAMGAMWHVTPRWQRLWLYGSRWVFMFDMAQDFDEDDRSAQNGAIQNGAAEERKSRKRKRDKHHAALQVGTSGAGSKKREEEVRGYGRKMRKLSDREDGKGWKWVEMQQETPTEEETDTDAEGEGLKPLRSYFDDSEDEEKEKEGEKEKAPTKFWHTYKYRPILGVVPLSEQVDTRERVVNDDDQDDQALEVALIERPTWDLDLLPPFVGVHERE